MNAETNVIYFNAQHISKEEERSAFRDNDQIHAYHIAENRWSQLPNCGRLWFGLAVIGGYLTVVGGKPNMKHSDSLNSLVSFRDGKWLEQLPAMPIKCSRPVVVTTPNNKYVIVTGGDCNGVEVLDCTTMKWSHICSQPKFTPCSGATDDNRLLLFATIGGSATCELSNLLMLCHKPTSDDSDIWHHLPYLPVDYSRPALLCGEVIAVGGVENSYDANADMPNCFGEATIYQCCEASESWLSIGHMKWSRQDCMVLNPTADQLIVAGGTALMGDSNHPSCFSIEQATVSRTVKKYE